MKIFSTIKNLVLVMLFVSSIALNVASVASTTVAIAMAGVFEMVTGFPSVMSKAKRTVSNVTTRISRRAVAGTTRNLGMMFGEAIPFIGVAAIVGATAWDLNDACETLKDMDYLKKAFNPEEKINEDVDKVCGQKIPNKEEVWEAVKNSPEKVWASTKQHLPDLPELRLPAPNGLPKTISEFIENIFGKWQLPDLPPQN